MTFANSDIQDLPLRYQVYQGRLLASFQNDAKYEHVGQDTRSQGGKDLNEKDLKILDSKKKSKDNEKGSRSKIAKHEGTSLQCRQRQRSQEINDKSNLIDLTKECHNELTLGEIGNGRIDGQAQVGRQGTYQGNGRNQNADAINDNIQGNVRNVIENNDRMGTYKEFLACHPKEYDGKDGAIVYTRWIEKMESIHDMSGCRDNQKAVQIVGTLTDEAIRNGSIKKNPKKRGNRGEPSKDRNGSHDNKKTRARNAFATTTNPVRRENTGHLAKDFRLTSRNVNPINARNPTARACYECGSTDHLKAACPRAFMLGAEKAHQDPNIVMGTFTLNNHYAITLFDSGVDYIFVSTTFIPVLGIEPSELGFSYEIKIASGQLVEIDKGTYTSYLLDGYDV
nr:reverse transcriptase domain-containing protein [Tanacetum cinerariifolium]